MILQSMIPYNTTETHENKPADNYDNFYCWIPHVVNTEWITYLSMNL